MFTDWRSVIQRLTLGLAALTFVGWLLGELLLVLLAGTAIYMLYNLRQLSKLYFWLRKFNRSNPEPPPESRGIWGFIFDDIYLLQRREREVMQAMQGIIDKAQESTAALDMAVVMINSNSGLEWWNPAATRLLGLKTPQDRKQAVTNLIRDPVFVDYFGRANFGSPLKLASHVDPARMLEYQITSFGAGERLMLVRDITQLYKLEMMRKDFVANVSHELRTPITVITGYLETMLDDRANLPARWLRPIEQMAQQSQRMENIIRDLLTLSRLETRALSKEQTEDVQLSSLLRDVQHDAEHVFSSKQHQFIVDCPETLHVRGSYSEIYSALSNLVLNAAKYTPEKGQITLLASYSADGLRLSVKDNGLGIDPQHLPRLTERFYRVDESRSTDTGGTGLGLAIVKHVLARHGGKLEIRSELGKGSEFICLLPRDRVVDKS